MATKTSFKQQCPSCETMVPIRDSGLIGRKIDCPKCKYRFVVEDQSDGVQAEAPAAKGGKKAGAAAAGITAKGKPGLKAGAGAAAGKGSKEKAGGNSTMILGAGLAVVAVALLGVGGYFFFTSGDEEKKPAKTTGGSGDKPPPKEEKKVEKPVVAVASNVDITNLLPKSPAVLLVNVARSKNAAGIFPNSALKAATFDSAGSFDVKAFTNSFGFGPDKVTQMALAINPQGNWSFNILRTSADVVLNVKDSTARLKLTPGPRKKINTFEYYLIGADLDHLSIALFKNLKTRPTALHIYDANTLVLANVDQMEDFLDKKRQPDQQTKPAPTEKKPPQGGQGGMAGAQGFNGGRPMGMQGGQQQGFNGGRPMGGAPQGGPPQGFNGGRPTGMQGMQGGPPQGMNGGRPMGGMQGMKGGPPQGFNGGRPMGGAQGMRGGAQGMRGGVPPSNASDSFLTADQSMKRVFDALDFKKQTVTLVVDRTLVRSLDEWIAKHLLLKLAKSMLSKVGKSATDISKFPEQEGVIPSAVGYSLKSLSEDRCVVSSAGELTKLAHAEAAETGFRLVASVILPVVKSLYKIDIKLTGGRETFAGFVGFAGVQGMQGFNGGRPPGAAQGMQGFNGQQGFNGGRPPGMQGFNGAQGVQGGQPGFNGAQGMQGFNGSRPPGAAQGMQGFNGQQGFTGGRPPGGMQGFNGGRPGQGFNGGQAGGQEEVDPNASKFDTKQTDRMVLLTLDLHLSDHAKVYEAFRAVLVEHLVGIRSGAIMVNHRSYRQDLATAMLRYLADNKRFPRGTVDRPLTPGRVLPWRPNERVAWTAELLPYLGGSYTGLKVENGLSWNEGVNQQAATTAIPHLLAPDQPKGSYPQGSWRSDMPGLDSPAAATHFVGIAGIGLDAAEYAAKDPATAKLRGVFGYDRITRLTDITDGPSKTIALIQVPPTYKTCWLAGGGSTIRGVPETDSVEPFVCTTYKGKKGTFAIMADGKVRFIAATMNPETFKALCTIAGGEPIENIDAIAPVVVESTVLKPVLPSGLPKIPPQPKPGVEPPKRRVPPPPPERKAPPPPVRRKP